MTTDEAMDSLLKDMTARLDQDSFPARDIKALVLVNVMSIMLYDILEDPGLVAAQLRDAANRTEETAGIKRQ